MIYVDQINYIITFLKLYLLVSTSRKCIIVNIQDGDIMRREERILDVKHRWMLLSKDV